MGANAQTSVWTFTAGSVLTAAQMNDTARTGVPVFATTTTRDAAFGGTGEKTLAEGQMCYIEGTGLQSYNGSAWITWGTGGAWTSYTPTIKGGATTVTANIVYAKYSQIGKTVTVQVCAGVTSAGAANGKLTISLPSGLVPATQNNDLPRGTFWIRDTGTAYFVGVASIVNDLVNGTAYNAADTMGINTPAMTLANGDVIGCEVTYEVA